MKDTRPINLNLFTISFPITAVVSILHRMAGVVLFFFIPSLLWILHLSLSSPTDFRVVKSYFDHACYKWLIWMFASMLIYHLLAGIRHLIMDCGIGESKCIARASARLVLVFSVVAILFLGKILVWR